MTTLPQHLHEAERLLGKGIKLVKLHQNQKRPVGDGWNQGENTAKRIDPSATGYGIPLAVNGLASIDPDNVDLATAGLAALGFDLEDWMQAGVRTCSTRIGSGGRSAFKYQDGLRWLKFSSDETGTVLELRAESANLQDCCPGVQYLDKDGNECSQDYDPFTDAFFDDAPALPEDLRGWWLRCANDIEYLRDQQQKFFEALGTHAHLAISAGGSLAYPSRVRMDFNERTTVPSILARHGYTEHNGRWAPATATGAPAVRLIAGKKDLWHSDHASDPLFGNFDAWTAFVVLDHGGDLVAAERALGEHILDGFEVIDEEGAVVTGFDALEREARAVTGRDTFKSFAEKVAGIPMAALNGTDRTMLAGIVFGLRVLDGMTKANIEKAFKHTPKTIEKAGRPRYERNEEGFIMNTTGNIVMALSCESEIGIRIALDEFTDSIKFSRDKGATWQPFGDKHYTDVQIVLERLGIYGVNTQRVRECVFSVAVDNAIDTAQIWLGGLSWDGVPRVERFFVDYFGVEDGAYVRAVGRYLWSALAGRVLVPGIQADMIPVLIGKQGVRKSTSIAAMAPAMEFFSELSFGESETESARKMRGCLVGELAELKGINSKDKEHIKAWLTRRFEQWTPKYKEFATTFARRHMFIGSTNTRQFLEEDSTGHRRWLPIDVGGGEVELIERDRDQLWAEGAVLFGECGGICFKEAERLAKFIHDDFIRTDIFLAPIVDYLEEMRGLDGGTGGSWKGLRLTTNKLMVDALGLDDARTKPFESARIAEIMVRLGWKITRPRTVDPEVPGKVHRYPTWVYAGEGDK